MTTGIHSLTLRLTILPVAAFLSSGCRKTAATADPPPPSAEARSETIPAAVPEPQPEAREKSPWGMAVHLPKDTEGFTALYDLDGLIRRLSENRWMEQLESDGLTGPLVQDSRQWLHSSGRAEEILTLLRETAGKETLLVLPEGFSDRQAAWSRLAATAGARLIASAARALIVTFDRNGRRAEAPFIPPLSGLELLEAAADLEIPPVMLAVHGGNRRGELETLLSMTLPHLSGSARMESWTTNTGEIFQSIRWSRTPVEIAQALEAIQSAKLPVEFGNGNPRAKAAMAMLAAKSLEISWGWKGDHLILAAGGDHRHVRFAPAGESIMTLPELTAHTGAWLERKPFFLSYSSRQAEQAAEHRSLWLTLSELATWAGNHTSIPLRPLAKSLDELHRRSMALWPPDADAMVSAAWLENGLKGECFGGPRLNSHDASRPLTFPRLAGPSTFFFHASRTDRSASDRQFAFLEEAAGHLWKCYEDAIKPGIRNPSGDGGFLLTIESFATAGVRDFWNGLRHFRNALGAESMFMVQLDGEPPASTGGARPNTPFPRAIFVSELDDRNELTMASKAWPWLGSLASAMDEAGPGDEPPRDVESKTGSLTAWGRLRPGQSRETWLHTAASDSRWYLSTSHSLTVSINALSPRPEDQPAASMTRVNIDALRNSLEKFLRTAPQTSSGPGAPAEFLRAVQDFTLITGRHGSLTRRQWHLRTRSLP